MAALLVLGKGHWLGGVAVMICAYAVSLLVTERLFIIVKPKLLRLPWFAALWDWFVAIRDKVLAWLRFKLATGRKPLCEDGRR